MSSTAAEEALDYGRAARRLVLDRRRPREIVLERGMLLAALLIDARDPALGRERAWPWLRLLQGR